MISTKAQSFLCSGLNALDQLAMALGSQFIFCRKVLFLHSGKKKKKKKMLQAYLQFIQIDVVPE